MDAISKKPVRTFKKSPPDKQKSSSLLPLWLVFYFLGNSARAMQCSVYLHLLLGLRLFRELLNGDWKLKGKR